MGAFNSRSAETTSAHRSPCPHSVIKRTMLLLKTPTPRQTRLFRTLQPKLLEVSPRLLDSPQLPMHPERLQETLLSSCALNIRSVQRNLDLAIVRKRRNIKRMSTLSTSRVSSYKTRRSLLTNLRSSSWSVVEVSR